MVGNDLSSFFNAVYIVGRCFILAGESVEPMGTRKSF